MQASEAGSQNQPPLSPIKRIVVACDGMCCVHMEYMISICCIYM